MNHACFKKHTKSAKYWAGFLLADGNVHIRKHNQAIITLSLQTRDKDHVAKFSLFSGTNKPIYTSKRGESSITLFSDQIAADLLKYGITKKKTFTAKVPDWLIYDRDFWRGVFDGDGWVSNNKRNDCEITLLGTKNVVKAFQKFTGIKQTIKRRAGCYSISYYGDSARSIVKKLYHRASVCLERKKLRALWHYAS